MLLASATKIEHSEPHSHNNKVEYRAHDNGKITHGEDSKFHGTTVYTRGFKFGPSSKPTHAPTEASVICEDLPHGAYKRSCDGCELDQEKCLLKCNACVVKADDALLVPQPLTTYSDFDNKITGKYELDMSTCATNHAANKDGVLVCQDRKVLEDLGIKPKVEPDETREFIVRSVRHVNGILSMQGDLEGVSPPPQPAAGAAGPSRAGASAAAASSSGSGQRPPKRP